MEPIEKYYIEKNINADDEKSIISDDQSFQKVVIKKINL